MMSTVRDLIKGSLRLINAIASGETPSASEESDALEVMNHMLDAWSIEGFLVYQKVRETFSLVASQQTYTMGTGGNFNTTRPTLIAEAGVIQNGVETPIKIYNEQEWASISLKSTQSNLPSGIFADGSFPLLNVNVWPVPNAANSIALYSEKPISSFASANTTVSLPPGYEKALKFNHALEFAIEFGKEIDPRIVEIANETKANIKRQNVQPVLMQSDVLGLTGNRNYNFVTGE